LLQQFPIYLHISGCSQPNSEPRKNKVIAAQLYEVIASILMI